ncbi:hypothetical protein Tco_0960083 [Tanacetum coccineum]
MPRLRVAVVVSRKLPKILLGKWRMPVGRIMGDMVMLPTCDVVIINGSQAGSQGFELASEPYGRILVAGSNSHAYYNFSTKFPTEQNIKAFLPKYLSLWNQIMRPTIEELPEKINYGDTFDIHVIGELPGVLGYPEVNIASAPFATHSFSQIFSAILVCIMSD